LAIDPSAFLQRAIELARDNVRLGGGPFGAVVVKHEQIVGEGVNSVTRSNDPTAHAEIMAIRAACAELNDFSLTGAHIFTSCEPCPMCLGAIYWARLGKIWYAATRADAAHIGFDDDFLYRELSLPVAARSLPVEQLEQADAVQVMHQWARNPERARY